MQNNSETTTISIKTFKQIFYYIAIFSLLFFPLFVGAQGGGVIPNPPTDPIKIKISNPFNCGNASGANCTIFTLVYAILNNIVMPIAAVAVTMWIIYAGFTFLTAQGNSTKIQAAQQRLLWSLIGAGILLGAVGIAKVVENTVKALIAP